MQFKSILTVVTDPDRAELAVAAGAQLALMNDGHLDVLSLGIDMAQIGYSYIESGAVLSSWSLEQAECDARTAAAAASTALAGLEPDLRWAEEMVVAVAGRAGTVVGEKAAYADLVVQPLPGTKAGGLRAEAIIEAALFEGRAPVLIIPDEAHLKMVASPRRIILGWNQSTEALTAAKRALPLLRMAHVVDVTVVDPQLDSPERSDPGGILCQFLARHGVKAEVTVLVRSLPRISDVLAQHALDQNADMLVMGAFSHSRLREAVLGGATREILQSSRIPVFMAH